MALRPDFVISDTHFGHKNIVQYQDRPYDHEVMMIKRWRSTVQASHTVLHLGDLFFSKQKGLARFTEEIAPQLTGRKFLVLGNHDRHDFDYESIGFTVLKPYQVKYQDFTVSFDHYPRLLHDNERRLHVHGHVHKNGYGPEGHQARPNNINVSVEVIDYRPQRFTKLVNTAIRSRKSGGKYYNSKAYRQANIDRARRAA